MRIPTRRAIGPPRFARRHQFVAGAHRLNAGGKKIGNIFDTEIPECKPGENNTFRTVWAADEFAEGGIRG
jgi:hypothetical protein